MIKFLKCLIFGHHWEEVPPRNLYRMKDEGLGDEWEETIILRHCEYCDKYKTITLQGLYPTDGV